MASTTSFERKGLRFGMDSSPASAEVKGSTQAKRRETETESGEKVYATTRARRACRTTAD